jgi:hypothetical protein
MHEDLWIEMILFGVYQGKLNLMLLSGHGVVSFPIWVLYSHAGLVGTTEDLLSQMTNTACKSGLLVRK